MSPKNHYIVWMGLSFPLFVPMVALFLAGIFESFIFLIIGSSLIFGGAQYVVFLFWLRKRWKDKKDIYVNRDLWFLPLYFFPFCVLPIFLVGLISFSGDMLRLFSYENYHSLLLSAIMVFALGYMYVVIIKVWQHFGLCYDTKNGDAQLK